MPDDFKYQLNDEIICPYCDYEFQDSWECEVDEYERLRECDSCEREFHVYSETTVLYNSRRKDA